MPNVFILCTGRSGSVSVAKACQHITNFTSGHETKAKLLGEDRFAFPNNHIEVDNRLIWDLGRLEKHYGDNAYFIYLKRESKKISKSFIKRTYYPNSIFKAYCDGVKKTPTEKTNAKELKELSEDFVDNMTHSIEAFIKRQPRKLTIDIDHISTDFKRLWDFIGAEGDYQAAINTFNKKHNHSKPKNHFKYNFKIFLIRILKSKLK